MTHNSTAKNHDLADCTTNVFSLADIRGLRWKKYKCSCVNSTSTVDDPILTAYTVALRLDVLCVWRRVSTATLHEDAGTLFGCAKELVIFWYGDEPTIGHVPGPSIQEIDSGATEDGISPDYLDLFFKSIHNIIERNLLSSDFVRLGNWFTKPVKGKQNENSTVSSSLAFRFSIFIHGESTVVTAVNICEKDAVRCLCKKDMLKKSMNSSNADSKVMLAPYGLNAQLTGYSISDGDLRTTKILEEWKKFFPVNGGTHKAKSDICSSVVEVVLGEVKMLYPASLVLVPLSSVATTSKEHFTAASTTFNTTQQQKVVGNATEVVSHGSEAVFSSLKVMGSTWGVMQHKEQHMPETKLWDMKENHYQAGCACCSAKSTIPTSAKTVSSANPFKPITSTSPNNAPPSSLLSKVKKENQSPPVNSFHQRRRPKKPQGRLTPSISGRLTPSVSSAARNSTVLPPQTCSSVEKSIATAPLATNLSSVNPVTAAHLNVATELALVSSNIFGALSATRPCQSDPSLPMNKQSHKTSMYSAPQPQSFFRRPVLPSNHLDPMQGEGEGGNMLMEDCQNRMRNQVKRELDNETISCANDKIKSEPDTVPMHGTDKSCSNATSLVQSPSSVERKSPAKRRHSNSSSPLPVSSERKPKSATNEGIPSVTGTSSENEVFTFGSKVISLPSPPTPHFSPTVKSTSTSSCLMTTKDLAPISDDLDHLFDDDEDENATLKKISMSIPEPAMNGPPTVEDEQKLAVSSSLSSSVTSSVSQQDLERMFPTPPSPSPSVFPDASPANLDITENHAESSSHTHSLSEKADKMNVKLETESLLSADYIFSPPLLHMQEIPDTYLPLTLPSASWKSSHAKQLKLLTWNALPPIRPPILSRRPSGKRLSPVVENTNVKLPLPPTIDPKLNLPLTSPCAQQYFSSLPPPPPSISPNSSNINDNQSLLVNLTLTDSHINWMSCHTNEACDQTIQSTTCELFNNYQNLHWKSCPHNLQSDLFPEDAPYRLSSGSSYYCKKVKLLEQVSVLKISIATDVSELLLKHFLSPFAVEYLMHTLDRYYSCPSYHIKSRLKTTTRRSIMQKGKLLKDLHLYLQRALQKPVSKGMFDTPKIEGPLSFKNLNNKVMKKKGMQSSMSANSLLFNYDGDSISISPSAIQHWQHLQLEPFGGTRNVAYVVALPESDFVVNTSRQFFRELNSMYEALNLGVHYPIRDEIRISQKLVQKSSAAKVDDWFKQNESKPLTKLRSVAQFCKSQLGPYLATLNLDSISPSPPKSSQSSTNSSIKLCEETSQPSASCSEASSTLDQAKNANSLAGTVHEDPPSESQTQPPTLVVYMVDPFHSEVSAENSPKFWSYFGLMRCFIEMKSQLHPSAVENTLLQVIPLEQILQTDLNARGGNTSGSQTQELKNLALSVYSRCRASALKWMKKTEKCMTGFGVCNSRDNLFRKRQTALSPRIFMPPYIISEPSKLTNIDDKSNKDADGLGVLAECPVNILFCSYMLSVDNQFLLVACTDKVGELNESTFIQMTYPKREKNKCLIWSIVIRKLWEYIAVLTSSSVSSWRVVISKLGNIGHMELKELHTITQEQIQNTVPVHQAGRPTSPAVADACTSCTMDEKKKGKSLIRSISVCSIAEKCDIDLVSVKGTHHTTSLNSRIYVMPTAKGHLANTSRTKANNTTNRGSEMLPLEHVFSTSFEVDDQEPMQTAFYPLLSPADSTVFQTSSPRQQDMTAKMLSSPQNISSPQSNSNNTASLSPFTPIPNKHIYMTSPTRSSSVFYQDHNEPGGNLSVGYILSGSSLDEVSDSEPNIVKCDLHQHVSVVAATATTSGSTASHPLDSRNYMDVLKYVLECFDSLSWLTIDPSTGSRHSCLPVHVRTLCTMQKILKNFSSQ